jgi:hypothetical protein
MITDTAFFRNPNYHRPSDTIDTLDFTFMAQLVKSLELALLELPPVPNALCRIARNSSVFRPTPSPLKLAPHECGQAVPILLGAKIARPQEFNQAVPFAI